jgi:YggT family protein
MFILANFLNAVAMVVDLMLGLFLILIIIRALLSWVSPDPYNPIVRFLYSATEPLLYRVRRTIPAIAGGIDLSPLIIIAAIYFLQVFLVQSLRDLALAIR